MTNMERRANKPRRSTSLRRFRCVLPGSGSPRAHATRARPGPSNLETLLERENASRFWRRRRRLGQARSRHSRTLRALCECVYNVNRVPVPSVPRRAPPVSTLPRVPESQTVCGSEDMNQTRRCRMLKTCCTVRGAGAMRTPVYERCPETHSVARAAAARLTRRS